MTEAIELARKNVASGGGPFAALVVKDGRVLATGLNQVTASNDPTAHAEVSAIRAACTALGSFQLTGCELYSSCEPCPMCLGAIYWARPERVYFAATQDDAAAAGFDDRQIYHEIALPHSERSIPMMHVTELEAVTPFRDWVNLATKTHY